MAAADRGDVSPDDPPSEVNGIGDARREDLADAGYESVRDLQVADTDELTGVLPADVARSVKAQVGQSVRPLTTASEARDKAQDIPGAMAKVVKDPSGNPRPKVLEKVDERHEPGATVQIHKG